MEFKIDETYENTRVDKYIRKKFEGLNLSTIFKLIRKKKIKVNMKKTKENYRLQIGDIVSVYVQDGETKEKELLKLSESRKVEIKNSIVYEDDEIILINKESGQVMHKGSNHEYGLSEEVKGYLENNTFTFVNRIDRFTSGIVLGSKNLKTTRYLSELMRERQIKKKYYIVVDGLVEEDNFEITSYLKKTEHGVVQLDEYEDGAKKSISYFKVVKRGSKNTLLIGELGTGRTHQLRVQLMEKGHPILGDPKYGRTKDSNMCLFSYYLEIEDLNLKKELDIPREYMDKL